MGFKQIEVVPPQISPLQPTGKAHQIKVFQVSRTDTTATLKAMLPAQASITNVYKYGSTASDAGTTATITITVANNTGTISTSGASSVLSAGNINALLNMTNIPNIEPLPLAGDLRISAQYAETGTASTTGGPWKIAVEYVA